MILTEDRRPVLELGYAVIEQAVHDLKAMLRTGRITKDGKLKAAKLRYNPKNRVTRSVHYTATGDTGDASVRALIYFFRGGELDEWLQGLGSELSAADVWAGAVRSCQAARTGPRRIVSPRSENGTLKTLATTGTGERPRRGRHWLKRKVNR